MLTSKEKLLSKLALVNFIKKCPPDARPRLISYLSSDGIKVLAETVDNILHNRTLPLKKSQKIRIKKEYTKDKKALLEISKKKGSIKNKKKLLEQSGGFLGTLLGITKLTRFKGNKF